MRRAVEVRRKLAQEINQVLGIKSKWVPGNNIPGPKNWKKYNSEAVEVNISLSLFADDTIIIVKKGKIDTGEEKIKNIRAKFEEKNNDDKEETLDFGTEEGKKIRMLDGHRDRPEEQNKERRSTRV